MPLRYALSAAFVLLRSWIWFWALLCSLPAWSQVEEPTTGELLESFFRENEQVNEAEAQMFLEFLENVRRRPLDLNRVGRDELSALRLLNELQIENFLQYRDQLGPLLNVYELQAIPGWDLADIRRLLPFVGVNTGLDDRYGSVWRGLLRGRNELLVRWGRPTPWNFRQAEGNADWLGMRFLHTFDQRLRFGLTAEKDPGEAFFRGSNPRGFDFYSAHFWVQNAHPVVRALALGDYSVRLGQGLILQTRFAPGKSAETTAIVRSGPRIAPYSAFGEAFFLRGGAAVLRLGRHWEATVLGSYRRRDANVREIIDSTDLEPIDRFFTSLQTAGLHRTPSEIRNEGAIGEWLGGAVLARNWRSGQVALNAVHLQYDVPWRPTPAPYRLYAFQGQRLTSLSADYFWRRRNWYAFGEIARSNNGAAATLNGLLFSVDSRVTMALLHRYFDPRYQAIYAAPFAETSGANNEHGLYWGADVRFGRKWQINAYADLWRHPWLRFGANAPSLGREYLSRIIWTPQRGVSFYVLWFREVKERNSSQHPERALLEHQRQRLRLHAAYRVGGGIEMRSRVEWTHFSVINSQPSRGFLAYQEVVVKPLQSRFSGLGRFVIFDTQDYDARIYAFENDLFAAVSIPGFAGRGSRYFVNLQWRVAPWLRLEARYEQTIQRVPSSPSGAIGRFSEWKLQARFRWNDEAEQ
ncbi:MAG: helix-hairpin-helix domain-containing protein [Saprospiraceae bacterium]|nr:helix-hairpin-helix domain-containing protein [Saprospiraceae bacterium]MDW8229497.1 helix-hairpin-helix domain-containing protein [Saprospiraceae bacterium]